MLLAGIVVLHPLMDQPVPLFGSKLVCRRFYAGVALIVLSIAINF